MKNQIEDSLSKISINVRIISDMVKSLESRCYPSIPIDHTLKSRIILYQQIHLRRVLELLKGISICAEQHLALPTILAARAFLETVAVFTAFHDDLEKAIKAKDFSQAYNIVAKYIQMTRDESLLNTLSEKKHKSHTATNICTHIEKKLAKHNPAAKDTYDRLSGKCHPNYEGLFGLYAAMDEENNVVFFTETEKHLNEILDAMIEIKNSGKPFYNLLNSIYNLMKDHADEPERHY